jgi:hypothetical protein
MANYQAADGTLFQSNAASFPGYAQPVVQLSDAAYAAAIAAIVPPTPPAPTQAQKIAGAFPGIMATAIGATAIPTNSWANVDAALRKL